MLSVFWQNLRNLNFLRISQASQNSITCTMLQKSQEYFSEALKTRIKKMIKAEY